MQSLPHQLVRPPPSNAQSIGAWDGFLQRLRYILTALLLVLHRRAGVQRIARRNGVMPEQRIRLMDEIRFDWTGADPLS